MSKKLQACFLTAGCKKTASNLSGCAGKSRTDFQVKERENENRLIRQTKTAKEEKNIQDLGAMLQRHLGN